MEFLKCTSCKSRPLLENGKATGKDLYACTVSTSNNFTFEDYYLSPKEVGYYTPHVVVRKYDFNGKKRFVPVARLGDFIGLTLPEGQGNDIGLTD